MIQKILLTVNKLLHLGIKNEQVHFVLHSIFRNFAANIGKKRCIR